MHNRSGYDRKSNLPCKICQKGCRYGISARKMPDFRKIYCRSDEEYKLLVYLMWNIVYLWMVHFTIRKESFTGKNFDQVIHLLSSIGEIIPMNVSFRVNDYSVAEDRKLSGYNIMVFPST